MDDIYFSDKKKKENQDNNDKYLKADYFDEDFSLDFKKTKGNAQSFVSEKSLDDDSFVSFGAESDAQEKPAARRPVPTSELYSGAGTEQKNEAPASRNAVSHSPAVRPVASRPSGTRPPVQRASAQRPAGTPVRRTPSGAPVGSPSRTPSGKRVPAQANAAGKKPNKRSSDNKKKIIIAVVAAVVLLIAGIAIWAFATFDNIIDNLDYDTTIVHDQYLSSDAPQSEEVRNILLIGSDVRYDGSVKGKRSDTMILLSIDAANEQIKLTSFLRDSYVTIPYKVDGVDKSYKGKMNAAYGKGGAQGVIDSIEYNFGINVHNYASVDFSTFEKIVDLLGGVTIEGVTAKEARYMNSEADTNITEGTNHMNGYEALWYCRIRKLDSDFYRTMRQRKVLTAIIRRASELKYSELINMVEQVLPDVSTDLSKKDIKNLGLNAIANYLGYDIVQQQIPADGTWRDGRANGSYVIDFDLEANKQVVRDFVYNKYEKEPEATEQAS